MNKNTLIEAVVERVVRGQHGRFVVTIAKGFTNSVTFSLIDGVWQEDEDPEPGICVILSDIRKKHVRNYDQWRAYKARFFRIEDEKKKKISQ